MPDAVSGLAGFLEATLLSADARAEQVNAMVREAAALGCAGACVHPVHVAAAARAGGGSSIRIVSVAGFPLGASPVAAKIVECRHALDHGAGELDIVIPIWAAVAGELALVEEELARILEATKGATRKLILEVALLPPPVLEQVSGILNRLKPEYAKTGTGYCRPVTPEDVVGLRRLLDPSIAIKAAGGIRTREQAEGLVAVGAARLGTSRAAAILARG
jgi:deoxyribose-phosphate aldolase